MKKLYLSLLLSMVATMALWAEHNSYFKVVSGSFESGDVTLEVTYPDAMRVESNPAEQYASIALYNDRTSLSRIYVKDGEVSATGNKVTMRFKDFTAPAGADAKKYYLFSTNKNWLMDGETPTDDYYIYAKDYQPYAEVESGSLESGSLVVKVTVPYADVLAAYSSTKRVTLKYTDGTYKGVAIATSYMSDVIAYEGNTMTIPFTLDLGTKRNTLINWSIGITISSFKADGSSNSAAFTVPFTDVCPHSNVREYPYQEPEGYTGCIACLECQDCHKNFCTWDTEHTNPLPWKVFALPTYDSSCAHAHYTNGKCDACGRKCPHVNGTKAVTPECTGRYAMVYQCVDCAKCFMESDCRNGIADLALTHIFPPADQLYLKECINGCGRIDPAKCKHNHVEMCEAVESCEGTGYREHAECTDCGILIDEEGEIRPLEYFEVPATGHNFNFYGVCSGCGMEDTDGMYFYACDDHALKAIGTTRPNCTADFSTGADYYRCNRCERYICVTETKQQVIVKSQLPVFTPGNVFHGDNLVKVEATEGGCYTNGHARHQHCTACDARYSYYDSAKYCTWENSYSQDYYEKYILFKAHNGHDFNGTAVCSRCGFEATFREVTRTGELMKNAFYIIVSKIGDQYYALGKPAERVNDELWEHSGSNGYEAIPVEVNEDGTITISDPKVAQLYAAANSNLSLYPKVEWITLYAFFDPIDGQFLAPFPNTPYAAGLSIADGMWNPDERIHMSLSIYDGKASLTHEDDPKKSRCEVDMNDFVDKGTLLYKHPYAAAHTTVYPHAVYMGQNPGEAPRFHFGGWIYAKDSYHRADPEYAKRYPAHIYLVDTEAHVSAEGTNAVGRGRMSKRDVEEIVAAAAENYQSITSAGGADELASLTTIDLSAATFTDDMTAADIETLKDAEGISDNVLVIVPSSSDVKGTNIVNNGECENLVITDKANMSIESNFTAANASYERAMTGTSLWGTLCMPFAVESNDNVQLYSLDAVSMEDGTGVMTFKAIEAVEAGQPVIFRKKVADATGIKVAATNAQLKAGDAAGVSTNVDDWSIRGTYAQTTIQSGKDKEGNADDVKRYYIASDSFCDASRAATIPAFRAWFEAVENAVGVKAASFVIFVEDKDDTRVLDIDAEGNLHECTEIYDLNGRKLAEPVKGQVNIINGRKIMMK